MAHDPRSAVEGETTTEERIQSVEVLADDKRVPPVKVPKSYYIIDHIEGVTKNADGTVIGPIETSPQNSRGAQSSRIQLPWNQIITFLGVALIALAAFLFLKRAASSRAG